MRRDQRKGRASHDAGGRRRAALPGGLTARQFAIRPVAPDDKAAIRDAYEHLSDDSRYSRFLALADTLSDDQLRFLTEIDHHDHEALVAYDPETRAGIGVARYVRSPDDPEIAEAAVVVADDWQRGGVGTALLRQLADHARSEGIRRFDATLLARNLKALGLIASLGPSRVIERDGPTITVAIDLPPEGLGAHMRGVLRTVAAGEAELSPEAKPPTSSASRSG